MAEEYDEPWKEIIDVYLEPALLLLFPKIHAAIDWSKGYDSLEQELSRITPTGESDLTAVDKLIRVRMKNGKRRVLCIHLEIQSQRKKNFPKRMFLYHVRILDGYGEHPRSLAILADESRSWRPSEYRFRKGGTKGRFSFEMAKLLDFESRFAELEQSTNPFAVMVETHLRTLQTRKDPGQRRQDKLKIVKSLRTRGFPVEEVRRLFRFLDWLMKLPPELNRPWWEEVQSFDKEQTVPFIDIMTREAIEKGFNQGNEHGFRLGQEVGRKEGLQQGRRAALLDAALTVLSIRFGEQAGIRQQIEGVTDQSLLLEITRLLSAASSIEELNQKLGLILAS